MNKVTLALDWTPNTNHTGFFVAKELGFYTEAGLDVDILSPASDGYATTPAKKLELGECDFAIAPFESVISLNTKARKVNAFAIAALLQEDISSIVTLTGSGITRPRDLSGRTYASYQARYEDAIVTQMIINDGGTGDLDIVYPAKLGIWDTLVNNEADSTWIFDNWEGIEAESNGLPLTHFRLADYGIPYAYSPVILTTKEGLSENTEVYKAFLQATKRGFQSAIAKPTQAVGILTNHLPERDIKMINVGKSQEYVLPYYGNEGNWGVMEKSRIDRFLNWLVEHKLEDEAVLHFELFTNSLLK
ncbi:ABC transporter substrate-binding protein [Persicitalea jodogahamensis]|uniref:Thiamine pyrimidine synthase n=1 Tax=Persicitalea jodogahamensis TaxID=402147 RepID=A0A8J3DBL3_9BACT|nr:ABC transporter substrate-binding protein [Persicitalea jodogahamensis]GHB73054.1 nitrate ABC transporter substrate-binding protein [Persicitalea jodogahamensis]